MPEVTIATNSMNTVARTQQLFNEHRQSVFCSTDHLFALLLTIEWLAGIIVAFIVSPRAWIGHASYIHIHVWAAIFLGGAIISLPVYLALTHSGSSLTRHIIAISQMLYSSLLIHLCGGRIETHFHVFGSLALLAFYRDWRVLMSASIVVAADHIMRGIYWPQSVYGILTPSPWRWVEHAGWVCFEDIFLIRSCRLQVKEMWQIAQRQAEVESTRAGVELQVEQRTTELKKSERLRTAHYEVTRALAESIDLKEAAPKFLAAIGSITGWDAATLWKFNTKINELEFESAWYSDQLCTLEFELSSRMRRFRPGEGLPGLTLLKRAPLWCEDILKDPYFLRKDAAAKVGLHSAYYFPILRSNEIIGIVEFISREVRTPDDDLLRMANSLGQQIGQFVERTRAQVDNRKLAKIVQSSNDAIISLDLKDNITSWNQGAEKLYGYSANEVLGKHLNIIVPKSERAAVSSCEHVPNSVDSESHETLRIRKDSTIVHVSETRSPLLSESGEVAGLSVIDRDISAKKEAEKRVNEFYSTVSHELRTPLTSIRGTLGLIEGGIVEFGTNEAKELLSTARESSDRLIRLINDILDLRKVEAGKIDLLLQAVQVDKLISSTLESLKTMADEAGVTLTPEIKEQSCVKADIDRATQILTNLVSNAIRFSEAGQEVKIVVDSEHTGFVRFNVIDQGIGIADNQMHKLFGKFQQLDSSDSRQRGGTGLGLAICKALVSEHGGNIGVTSTLGEGSTFWFELPTMSAEETPPCKQSAQLELVPASNVAVLNNYLTTSNQRRQSQ